MRQLAVLHLVIQRHLVVALFVQHNARIRARCAFRQQIIRVNRRFIFSILIIRVADNQRAAPEVRFGDAELLVIAVRIRRERKLRVAVQRVDILLQIKPQGNRIAQCLDENRLLIFVRCHAGEARQEESSQPPAKVLVVTADGILLGIARVNPSIYGICREVIDGYALLLAAFAQACHAVRVLSRVSKQRHCARVIPRFLRRYCLFIAACAAKRVAVRITRKFRVEGNRSIVISACRFRLRLLIAVLLRQCRAARIVAQRVQQGGGFGIIPLLSKLLCLNLLFIRERIAVGGQVHPQRRANPQFLRHALRSDRAADIQKARVVAFLAR